MVPSAKKTAQMIFESLRLKKLPRTGWLDFAFPAESVADHSFGTALIALVLSKMENLDKSSEADLLKLAILHDLAEAKTGDLSKLQKAFVNADTKKAKSSMLLGTVLEDEITATYPDRLLQLCTDADKLDMLFQALSYKASGAKTDQFVKSALLQIKSKSAKRLAAEALRLTHP
ncbi:MAG: HD domain-containing protein [Candidatus Anstonellaceae archaeon]